MDLKVGMYVRTEGGLIAKYIKVNNEYGEHIFDGKIDWFYEYYRNEIDFEEWEEFISESVVKVSHNIIDLIEVGDYVNGYKIIRIDEPHRLVPVRVLKTKCESDEYTSFFEEDIKTIVTKEQFESMEYKVGE